MEYLIRLLVAFLMFANVYGTDLQEKVDDDFGTKMKTDPVYKELIEENMEGPWIKYRDELEKQKKRNPKHWGDYYSTDLIEIPVVVHVIYKQDEFIIGNEQIQSGFRILNDAYFDINYWNKSPLDEYEYLSANFSMQFKLSQIKYIDATGQGPEFDDPTAEAWGWKEEEVINVSSNFDQQHYLHFYLVSRIFVESSWIVYGKSSFPFPTMTMSECLPLVGFPNGIPNGDECFQNSIFAVYFPILQNIVEISNNATKCVSFLSPMDPYVNETNCIDGVNKMINEFAGYGYIVADIFDDAECIKLHNDICGKFTADDPGQVILFASEYFQTNEDDTRGTFPLIWTQLHILVPHEVGHWVGLRHIFSDVADCSKGDQVSDTLPQLTSSKDCPENSTVSCNSTDMYNNWMDYSKCEDLKYMFTEGQIERGRYFFDNETGFRHSFVEYKSSIVRKFINSIYFIIEEETVTQNPCHSGDIWVEQNINAGNEGSIIYMCATYSMNPLVYKITELKFTKQSFSLGYLDCGGDGWEKIDINLNGGNIGDEIYLCYKKAPYECATKAITNVNILVTNMEYNQKKLKSSQKWNVLRENLNENSGSKQYVYLTYNRKRKSKTDIFTASVEPIILGGLASSHLNSIDKEERLFSYDKLIYFLGLSSGLNVCAFSIILFGIIFYCRNNFAGAYEKIKQHDVIDDLEQINL